MTWTQDQPIVSVREVHKSFGDLEVLHLGEMDISRQGIEHLHGLNALTSLTLVLTGAGNVSMVHFFGIVKRIFHV